MPLVRHHSTSPSPRAALLATSRRVHATVTTILDRAGVTAFVAVRVLPGTRQQWTRVVLHGVTLESYPGAAARPLCRAEREALLTAIASACEAKAFIAVPTGGETWSLYPTTTATHADSGLRAEEQRQAGREMAARLTVAVRDHAAPFA